MRGLIRTAIVREPARGEGHPPSDIARVRLALALEASGVPLDAVGAAIRGGWISFDFLDALTPEPSRLLPHTMADTIDQLGIEPGLRRRIASILGTLAMSDDDPIRQEDAELFELVARAHRLGVGDEQLARITRSIYDAARRVAGAERDFANENLIGPARAKGLTEQQVLDTTSPARRVYRELGREASRILLDRAVEDAVFQDRVQLVERALAQEGIARPMDPSPPAVAFVDVTGYTQLTGQGGDEVAARQAAEFSGLAHDVSVAGSGQLVKLLGDGAMLVFDDVSHAVRSVLELLEQARDRGLPPLHAGIGAGPLVRRDGDYFGTVVNLASRTVDYARADECLVSQAVVDAWTGKEVRFQAIGSIALKGIADRLPSIRRSRPESRASGVLAGAPTRKAP